MIWLSPHAGCRTMSVWAVTGRMWWNCWRNTPSRGHLDRLVICACFLASLVMLLTFRINLPFAALQDLSLSKPQLLDLWDYIKVSAVIQKTNGKLKSKCFQRNGSKCDQNQRSGMIMRIMYVYSSFKDLKVICEALS